MKHERLSAGLFCLLPLAILKLCLSCFLFSLGLQYTKFVGGVLDSNFDNCCILDLHAPTGST